MDTLKQPLQWLQGLQGSGLKFRNLDGVGIRYTMMPVLTSANHRKAGIDWAESLLSGNPMLFSKLRGGGRIVRKECRGQMNLP